MDEKDENVRKLALEMASMLNRKAETTERELGDSKSKHLTKLEDHHLVRQPANLNDEHFALEDIDKLIEFISYCCIPFDPNDLTPLALKSFHYSNLTEVSVHDIEGAFRKYKKAKSSVGSEAYGRELMISLKYLLDKSALTPSGWFVQTDVKGGKRADGSRGDGKLTYAELKVGILNLCQELKLLPWSEADMHLLLKYMDPSGDGDLTAAEVELSFRKYLLPPETQVIFEAAGPIVSRLESYMSKRFLRVRDLFELMDDRQGHQKISIPNLKRAIMRVLHIPIPLDDSLRHAHAQTLDMDGSAHGHGPHRRGREKLRPTTVQLSDPVVAVQRFTGGSDPHFFGQSAGPAPPVVKRFFPVHIPIRKSLPSLAPIASSHSPKSPKSQKSPKNKARRGSSGSFSSAFSDDSRGSSLGSLGGSSNASGVHVHDNLKYPRRFKKPLHPDAVTSNHRSLHLPTQFEPTRSVAAGFLPPAGSPTFRPMRSRAWEGKQKTLAEIIGLEVDPALLAASAESLDATGASIGPGVGLAAGPGAKAVGLKELSASWKSTSKGKVLKVDPSSDKSKSGLARTPSELARLERMQLQGLKKYEAALRAMDKNLQQQLKRAAQL